MRLDRIAVKVLELSEYPDETQPISYLHSGHGLGGHSSYLWVWDRGMLRVSGLVDAMTASSQTHRDLLNETTFGKWSGRYEPETKILTVSLPNPHRREIPSSLWRDLERSFPDMVEVRKFG